MMTTILGQETSIFINFRVAAEEEGASGERSIDHKVDRLIYHDTLSDGHPLDNSRRTRELVGQQRVASLHGDVAPPLSPGAKRDR